MSQIPMDFSSAPEPEEEQKKPTGPRIVIFDLETQLSADEVGGWNNTHLMKVSVGCAYDSHTDKIHSFFHDQMEDLLKLLHEADLVVGFNSRRFDYGVLMGYTDENLRETLPTLDILEEIQKTLGHRLKLDSIASATVNAGKSADGLMALRWWKEGKIDEIEKYCIQDVQVTKDVYYYAKEKGHLFYENKFGKKIKFDIKFPPIPQKNIDQGSLF